MKRFKIEPSLQGGSKCFLLYERSWIFWPFWWRWDIVSVAEDMLDLKAIILHLETKP